jgi:GMP synthase (glutamine-hydrolysing)
MILLVDMNWKRDSLGYYEFVLPIAQVAGALDRCMVRHYLEVAAEDLSRCDKVILSGTALKDTATLDQPETFQWLKETEKPVLGVCAGMETIGLVFDAGLRRCVEIGMTPISTMVENPFFSGDFKAYSLHSVCVDVSGEFDVWAKSARCVQVIKHKRKNIIGVLFHPEVRNQEILKRFIQA